MLFLIEFVLIGLALVGAFAFPSLCRNAFAKLERLFARLARRRVTAVLVVGFLALTLRLALLPVEPVPAPETLEPEVPLSPPTTSTTILIVDDEIGIARGLARLLRRDGHHVDAVRLR